MRVDRSRIAERAIGVVDERSADEHAGIRTGEGGRTYPGVFQGFPGQLQQDSLLRVHLLGLARRDAEDRAVEAPDIVDNPRRPGVAFAALVAPRVAVALEQKTFLGDARNGATSVE